MARNRITEHPVISTLIATFLAWFVSMLVPQSRDWWLLRAQDIGSGLVKAWAWVWSPVPVPRFLAAVAVFIVLLFVAGVVVRFRQISSTSAPPRADEPKEWRDLTEDEKKVLQMLASADGATVWFNPIQSTLGSSRLKTEHTITMLQARNLIQWFGDFQHHGSAALTAFGRAACVYYGWAK